MRWLDSPICFWTKQYGEKKLLDYARLLKPFTLFPMYDPRAKQFLKNIDFMASFEVDPRMVKRWLAIKDLMHVLLTDGAYLSRILLWCYVNYVTYDRMILIPTEINAINTRLKNLGKAPLFELQI